MIVEFDTYIILALNRFAGRIPAIDEMIVAISDAPILKGGAFMACFWWLWFRRDDQTNIRRKAVIVAIGGAILAVAIARALQLGLPFHARPLHTPSLGFVLPVGVDPQQLNYWNSFPSDHAALFFALAMALYYQSHLLGVAAMAWTALVICLPRLYLGYHYPSDEISGAILGVVMMMVVQRALADSCLPERLVRWEATHATLFYCVGFVVSFELALLFYDLRHLAKVAYDVLRALVALA